MAGFAAAFFLVTVVLGGAAWLAASWMVPAPPERFRTSMFEFELAPEWSCVQEETEHVCRKASAPKHAVVILTMKERGPQDTVRAYRQHLERPQPLKHDDGTTRPSTVVAVGQRRLGGRAWVVGRHFESEVPGYYTDYYAALTSHKAVLVTFSAHRTAVDAFRPDLERMIDTLKLYQD